MNWIEYQKQSPRTLPSLYVSYGINILEDPSISPNIPRGIVTSLRDLSYKADLAHMALGMCSELEELTEAIRKGDRVNIQEECTDILWYCSGTIRIFRSRNIILQQSSGIKFIEIDSNSSIHELSDVISKFSDIPKKMLAYKKEINVNIDICLTEETPKDNKAFYYVDDIDKLLYNVIEKTVAVMKRYYCDPEQGMQNNIDKLKARYPEKFTEHHATNRDLDKERKELEK